MSKVFADGAGINCDSPEDASSARCTFNINQALGIDPTNKRPKEFVQDVFGGTTLFIGILVTFAIVLSGLFIVFGGFDPQKTQKGKQGIKFGIIGLLLVLFSYVIIIIIQKLAAG